MGCGNGYGLKMYVGFVGGLERWCFIKLINICKKKYLG